MQGLGDERMHLELAPPAELSRQLLEDEADAGLAPVAVLATHGGLEIVPGMAIGCDGAVRSVKLVGDVSARADGRDPARRLEPHLGRAARGS